MYPNVSTYLNTPEAVEALCQSCGACCATFRVSFYWAETTAHPLGSVPEEMTTPLSPSRVCMNGTSSVTPRCCALQGEIGQHVSCLIYPVRSTTCREYEVFMPDGSLNPRCNQARAKHGLTPLEVNFHGGITTNPEDIKPLAQPCQTGPVQYMETPIEMPIEKHSLTLMPHSDASDISLHLNQSGLSGLIDDPLRHGG